MIWDWGSRLGLGIEIEGWGLWLGIEIRDLDEGLRLRFETVEGEKKNVDKKKLKKQSNIKAK